MSTTKLKKIKDYPAKLYRKREVLQRGNDGVLSDDSGKRYINFASFDYLGLSCNAQRTLTQGVGLMSQYAGSAGSPLVSGYTPLHRELEHQFCEHIGCEEAMVFSSGYMANIGVIQALCSRYDILYADKYCHASIIDGALVSRAKFMRYKHLDVEHLNEMLQRDSPHLGMIVTEGVFSVDGDIAKLEDLTRISSQQDKLLMIDDAHGFGVIGSQGKGSIEHVSASLTERCIYVLPMGKSMGCMGALVGGSKSVMNVILQYARTYCYDTSLSPLVVARALENLDRLQRDAWRRHKLQELIDYFVMLSINLCLPFIKSTTAIHALPIKSSQHAMNIFEKLKSHGFYVSCWRPPTVAKGESRIRVVLNCCHSKQDIERLLNTMSTLWHNMRELDAC